MMIQALLPELLFSIFMFSCPVNLYYDEEYQYPGEYVFPDCDLATKDQENGKNATQNLQEIVTTIISLRGTCQRFNTIITPKIIELLGLNKENIDPFLIRSTQANIPYFMKIAFNNKTAKANPNFVHKSDGHTPLLYTTKAQHCAACKLLLENKADVNMRQQAPKAGYNYNPDMALPILIAVRKGNPQLVTLFAQNKANLDIKRYDSEGNNCSLLSIPTEKDTLKALLDACSYKDYEKVWGSYAIKCTYRALQERKEYYREDIFASEDAELRRKCIRLLEKAQNYTNEQKLKLEQK